jgi:hypothetical protein
MSKITPIAAFLATTLCFAAPARADLPADMSQWLDGLTDRTHKWRDCPATDTQATASNPYFKFNPSTSDPRFSCRQVGPFTPPVASWTGPEKWYFQHARFLRVKPCETYPTCSKDNAECVESKYCKIEAVRVCTLTFVGLPQAVSPFGTGTGKNGCEMLWTEETEAQPPDLIPTK